MTERRNFSSGGPWEDLAAYSRAVRVGPFVYISGTTAIGVGGKLVGIGDAYAQTKQILKTIEASLIKTGASLEDVVRARVYVTDIAEAEKVCSALREVFHHIRPTSTLVEVKGLIMPEMLVEIECDALISSESDF